MAVFYGAKIIMPKDMPSTTQRNSNYAVYLRADKAFDTRDAEAKQIFENIRQEYGLGELQDTGLYRIGQTVMTSATIWMSTRSWDMTPSSWMRAAIWWTESPYQEAKHWS